MEFGVTRYLGEKGCPYRFYFFDTGGFDECGEFVGLNPVSSWVNGLR